MTEGYGKLKDVLVQLVHQWPARGDFQARDRVIGDALQELQDGPDGVAMRRHEDRLAALQRRCDRLLPKGHHARNGVLEAFGLRDVRLVQGGVLLLLSKAKAT